MTILKFPTRGEARVPERAGFITGDHMPRNFWQQFGANLRAARAEHNIAEEDAAQTFGVRLLTYQKWEQGARGRIPHEGVKDFTAKYGVSYDKLFQGCEGHTTLQQRAKGDELAAAVERMARVVADHGRIISDLAELVRGRQ